MKALFTFFMLLPFCLSAHAETLPATQKKAPTPQLRTNLYIVAPDQSTVLMDGILCLFDPSYSDDVDRKDARKMTNPGENWGMLRKTKVLAIERRSPLREEDTIFFKMWNMRIITYRLEVFTKDWISIGLQTFLEDKYLKTSTPLTMEQHNYLDFSVTSDPASRASDRFRLVFRRFPEARGGAMPLDFIAARAYLQGEGVTISWETANEKNVKSFQVERSTNGKSFQSLGKTIQPQNQTENHYESADAAPNSRLNFYRIRSTDIDGAVSYSDVMKVVALLSNHQYSLYPNPTTADNIRIQIRDAVKGAYHFQMYNSSGAPVIRQTENVQEGNHSVHLHAPAHLAKGLYRVMITAPDGSQKALSLVL